MRRKAGTRTNMQHTLWESREREREREKDRDRGKERASER